ILILPDAVPRKGHLRPLRIRQLERVSEYRYPPARRFWSIPPMPRSIDKDEDGGTWGPLVKALDPSTREFVFQLFLHHGNSSKAYRAAGLGAGLAPNALWTAAHRLAR